MSDKDPPIRRRIGRRLALWIGASSLVLGALLAAVLVPLERETLEQTAADQVALLAEAVAASYEVVDEASRTHPAREVLAQVARAPNVAHVDVLDHAGQVKASADPARIGQRYPIGERLRQATLDEELITVTYNIPWTRSCVGCHEAGHDPVGAVRVAVERRAAVSRVEKFHLLGGLALLVIFGALVGLVLVLTDRLVARPVRALARLMQRAEKGDFLVRAHVERDDEVGALGHAFNKMLKAITAMKANEIEREADLRLAQEELVYKKQLEEIAAQLQASNVALERRVRALELLIRAAHRFGSTLDKSALLDRLKALITEKLGWQDFAVFLVYQRDDGEAELRCERASGRVDTEEMRKAAFRVGEGITGFVAEIGAPCRVPDLREEGKSPRSKGVPRPVQEGAMLSVPMLHKGRVIGVMDFFADDEKAFDDETLEVVQALGAQMAMAVVNADLYAATLELSVTDPLTKLMNRRAMEQRLEIEVVRAQRFGLPLSVLMIDVDHFKQYNDRMGHLLGDEALKSVAATLERSVRKVDAVARFGGEEFCVILPRTDEVAALDVANKLAQAVRALKVPGCEKQPLGRMSISVGVAVYPDHLPAVLEAPATEVLLDVADQAAYEAKRRGRDRVISASDALGLRPKPALDELGQGSPTRGEEAAKRVEKET